MALLTDEELGTITLARTMAQQAVEVGSMKSLNGIVKAVHKAKINVLLIFMSEDEFNSNVNEQ